jgi:anti-sigma factor RsiW
MSSVFDNFMDEPSLLLLYATGEITAADRQAMEVRLASDAALRERLAEVQAQLDAYQQTMAALDAGMPPPVPEQIAERQVGRLVRQWATRRLANPAAVKTGRLHLPMWIYPVAAAASLLIAFIVWSVSHNAPGRNTLTRNLAPASDKYVETVNRQLSAQAVADLSGDQQDALLDAFNSGAVSDDTTSDLDEAGRTIASLQSTSDADSVFLSADSDSANPRGLQ